MSRLLEIDSVQLDFGRRRILSDVYLCCRTRSVTGLVGRNGSGKSCLLQLLFGTLKGQSASVRVDGRRIEQACSNKGLIHYLPQFHWIPGRLKLATVFRDYGLRLDDFLEIFPSEQYAGRTRMSDLSGGSRRLLELWLLLRSEAQFLLLDEPFTGLAPVYVEQMKPLIAQEQEKGILITDHRYQDVLNICNDVYVMNNGCLFPVKHPSDLQRHGYLRS